MNLNYIVYRNLKKNIKNYYLYVFALIFSVALYFSFVTLQFDPSMDEVAGSVKGGAAIGTSSVLLVAIVAIFLLYANTIFIKRRSREIGLFQLIGLTKGKIFRLLSAENLMLYFGSLVAGIAAGFAMSRLILMILFKILEIDAMAELRFSSEALGRTIIVFAAIYVLIMLMNYTFIKGQSILSLFKVNATTQTRIRKMPLWEIVLGLLGIAFIGGGYYISTQLFSGKYTEMSELMMAMITILALVIIGTYLFYKGSVSFLFNAIRKSKQGYLSINEVLSLSSIMFRMKSNALLLTIITTVSALAIGLLSLSYISYYSAEATAKESSPDDFGFASVEAKEKFAQALDAQKIKYKEIYMKPIMMEVDSSGIVEKSAFKSPDDRLLLTAVLSEKDFEGMDLQPEETTIVGYGGALQRFMSLSETGEVEFDTINGPVSLQVNGSSSEAVLPYYYGGGGAIFVVDESKYEEFVQARNPKVQRGEGKSDYYGIELADRSQRAEANEIFTEQKPEYPSFSQYEYELNQRSNMGLIMFIVGFLGLTFLITSGCILYFKQMDEGEEEKGGYTILRKLGFTQGDLLRGIQFKQLFGFGIPLVIGLCHSYFAVKSGWFFFGTEMLTPMILVMVLYTVLYSIFGFLSVLYYKRVIRESL
ncbi:MULTISPECIES: ABC transporter permease [unclassified Paenibacillus]|uniref:FtsX-like permease family protein n=1 Tax=unclassified Paenibacillus TaxID=185978 RepID=UPI0024059F2C|nr:MULTISPECIES: ABC transporter permease [unclassified Paenibacillus]MDF9844781.1 bacitracin transport system permease protein [Paenibacillus sp. PastF-2]MDF9851418.1 bacitracin transport system permease protein [Paenibacillus sp. PastM-2]MDF9857965.1 bacitracin transport system permease protein [Paenibacillus sp. PastF-1]MDH6483233.1 bacitracin transport system permease protein [Paenibacillus sp. PastH-2]MDH6510643.1 bacitracin transport system permease protein [Paenibacillus sp. PastM-3]